MGRQQIHHEFQNFSVAALATRDVVTSTSVLDASMLHGSQVKMCKAAATVDAHTTNQGPILVGLARGLSDAEIEECLEADPQKFEDVPAGEEANRAVWPIWFFPPAEETSLRNIMRVSRIPFPFKRREEGTSFVWWAYNLDTISLSAGAVQIWASWVTEWLRD